MFEFDLHHVILEILVIANTAAFLAHDTNIESRGIICTVRLPDKG